MTATVLLVEDNDLLRLLMLDTLEGEGFAVVAASDGHAAQAIINEGAVFDLVLTDVNMPGEIDGWAVAAHAKQRHPDVPVIIMSGRPFDIHRHPVLSRQCRLVNKPCSIVGLIETMRCLLAQRDFDAMHRQTSGVLLRLGGEKDSSAFAGQPPLLQVITGQSGQVGEQNAL